MANIHLHIPSFNAGELSPLLGARFAVEKVQSGCRRLRNFLIHTHGPAFRRPGFEYLGAAMSNDAKSRLLSFNFSTTTGFVLEFSPAGLGVWSNGVKVPLVEEVPLPYSEAECFELQVEQINDVCYIVHGNHPPRKLVRYADDDWRLSEVAWKWPPMADDNVRPEAINVPEVTAIASRPTYEWAEFIAATTSTYTFAILTPDLSGSSKSAILQRWNGSSWVNVHVKTWTTSAPTSSTGIPIAGASYRFTYSGPISTSVLRYSVLGLPVFTMATDEFLPAIEEPFVVLAGDWRVTLRCAETIPAGATLTVQKKPVSTWLDVAEINLLAGAIIETKMEALGADTDVRFVWSGRAMPGGEATAERLVYPVVNEIEVECSNTSGEDRTLTASEPIFKPGHEGSYWQISHRRDNAHAEIVSTVTSMSADTSAEIRVSGRWDVFTYGTWAATLYLERKVGATWEIVRSWVSLKDRNVIASGEELDSSYMRLRITSGTSAAASGAAVPRFILECADARVDGLVKIKSLGTMTDGATDEAIVDVIRELWSTDATAIWAEGAFSSVRGFPRALALNGDGRMYFGGIKAEPSRLWGSVVADYENFLRSSFDDASISVTPATQRSDLIQWLASFERELIIGTKGSEWTLSSEGAAIKPTDIQMQRRSGYGSALMPAIQVGDALVFLQRGSKRLRQVSPHSDSAEWSAVDITVLAEHVGLQGFVSMAVMSSPLMVLWAVTGDGKLLGMTFEREQNVFGWHVHETDGQFESVAVIAGAEQDELWVSILRDGPFAPLRTIERMDSLTLSRDFSNPEQLVYLDSAVRFEFEEPSDTLTGLTHLDGLAVYVLADGASVGPLTVMGGEVYLETAATIAIVGLPYTSELQPMRIEIPLRDGTSQHRNWRTSRVGLYVHESLGGEIADSPEGRFEKINARRVSTPMDSPPPLYTGEVETALESRTRPGVDVIIRQTLPLPLNIGSITVKGDVYGE